MLVPWHHGCASFLEPMCSHLHNTKSSNSFGGAVCISYPWKMLSPGSLRPLNEWHFLPQCQGRVIQPFNSVAGFGITAWLAGFPSGWACSLCQPGQPEPQERPLRAPCLNQGFTSQPEHHHPAQRAADLKLPQPRVKSLGTTFVSFHSKAGKQGVCREDFLGKGEVINESGS